MLGKTHRRGLSRVALRKESVDRNVILLAVLLSFILSLSARRAWIEIKKTPPYRTQRSAVALRKESVDRNLLPKSVTARGTCRSPQGERG